jgi:F420H(2)-dependent quinone reductase
MNAAGQNMLNLVMRAVLATPVLHRAVSDRVLVLDVIGRKSGKRYRIPVGYAPDGADVLIGTAGRWRRNLVADRPIEYVRARRRGRAAAEVVTDEERCTELYRRILAHNPVHGRFAGIRSEPDGAPNPEDLRRALAAGTAVVRLQPLPD